MRHRVLAAQVDVAARAAGRIAGDRHRLDQRERIALDHDAVLERARLGLVGVADQVVRPGRLARHRLPLDAGRERGAAAAHQLRVLDLADHALRPELDRQAQRLVAAGGAVRVEADRVDLARRARAAAGRRGLWQHRHRVAGDVLAAQRREHVAAVVGRQLELVRLSGRRSRRARRAHGRTGRGRDSGTRWRSRRRTASPSGPNRSSSCAISSSEPKQRHARSSQTWICRGGRGSVASIA